MAYSFIPKGQQGLLLKDPLTFGFSAPTDALDYKPIYSHQSACDQSKKLDPVDQDALLDGSTPKKVGFYTRNNPHPVRVRHIKGLCADVPICYIEDNAEQRDLMSAPSGQDLGSGYYPTGSTRFSARGDRLPAVGIVPIIFAWRDEFEKKESNAISRALGKPPPSRGGVLSRGGARSFDQMQDDRLLGLLCRTLQTESIPACQAWLKTASESEKTIVLNMVSGIATNGEIPSSRSRRPHTSDSDVCYRNSHTQKVKSSDRDTHQDNEDFKFSLQNKMEDNDRQGLNDVKEKVKAPFKFPENDTVLKTARQLSSPASRHGSRASKPADIKLAKTYSKEYRPPSNAAQLTIAKYLSKDTSGQLQGYLQKHNSDRHTTSASLSGPMSASNRVPISRRLRSRSVTAGSHGHSSFSPAHVKDSIREQNREGERSGSGHQQVRAKQKFRLHRGLQLDASFP